MSEIHRALVEIAEQRDNFKAQLAALRAEHEALKQDYSRLYARETELVNRHEKLVARVRQYARDLAAMVPIEDELLAMLEDE